MKFGKNFLILLTISGAITVTAFVAANTIQNRAMREIAISTNAQLQPVLEFEPVKTSDVVETRIAAKLPEARDTEEAPPKASETPKPTPIEKISFAKPAEGDISSKHSGDTLVFSNTFNDFRTHSGIDIIADKDSPVLAIADGIISKNYFDYEEGIVVEIEHKDGYISIYKNLGNDKMATVGKVIKKGEAISCVGDTGVFESNMPYHLHLEVSKNGELIDPEGLF